MRPFPLPSSKIQRWMLAGAGLVVARRASRPALMVVLAGAGWIWYRSQRERSEEGTPDGESVFEAPPLAVLAEEEALKRYLPPINTGQELPDEVAFSDDEASGES